jgi:hypothetical protein
LRTAQNETDCAPLVVHPQCKEMIRHCNQPATVHETQPVPPDSQPTVISMFAFRRFTITHLNTTVFYISLLFPTNRQSASRTLLPLHSSISAQSRSVCHCWTLITFDNALRTFKPHLTSAFNFIILVTPQTPHPLIYTPRFSDQYSACTFHNSACVLHAYPSNTPKCYHRIRKGILLFEGSQASLARPSDKNSIKMTIRLEHWRMMLTGETRSIGRKPRQNANLCTTNVTRLGLALNPDLSVERRATDRQSHGTASET